jgi:two-component system response regulator YesN
MEKLQLVIVDDEHRIGQLIGSLIHYDVLPVELIQVFDSSEAALECIIERKPDIVISDIQMPVLNGLELVRLSQENDVFPHFILISGFREFEYARTALKYGVKDYLLKPVQEKELNEVLSEVCQNCLASYEKREQQKKQEEAARKGHYMSGKEVISLLDKSDHDIGWVNLNSYFHTDIKDGKIMVFSLKLDFYTRNEQDELQDTMVLNNIIGMIENRLRGHVYEQLYMIQNNLQILGLVNYEEHLSDTIRRELSDVFMEIKQYIVGFVQYLITMSWGDETDLNDVRLSLRTARQRMNQRILYGTNRIIFDTSCAMDLDHLSLEAESVSSIRNSVESQDSRKLVEIFEHELKRAQERKAGNPMEYYILARNYMELVYDSLPYDFVPGEELDKKTVNETIDRCWSVELLKDTVSAAVAGIVENLKKTNEEQSRKPVRMAMEYIDNNYQNKISLEETADSIGINASYLSALFKKETGINFQNYLTQVRMEKAKELLKMTNETMMSIAIQVGYQDTRYFSETFYKVVGVKPSIYRKMYS